MVKVVFQRGDDNRNNIFGTPDEDRLYGYGGNDYMTGEARTDELFGGLGNDTMYGGAWSDYLFGEGDNDTLVGGSGRDFLTGGYGTDTFSFWAGHSGYSTNLSNADVIFDFNKQEGDKIDLSLANVSYFGGVDSLPEPNEVSYWFRNNVTVVSFHDGEAINDVVLFGTPRLNMVESDFIV